jgi:hypothetical protein
MTFVHEENTEFVLRLKWATKKGLEKIIFENSKYFIGYCKLSPHATGK